MVENILEDYPKDMKIKTLTRDCFDGVTETPECVVLKEKYIKRFQELAHDFAEDCINNQVESISQAGFFFAYLWPVFVEAQIDACYNHLHDVGNTKRVYKFEKVKPEK